MIPFFSFKDAPDALKDEWAAAISRVLDSGRFIGGNEVEEFEQSFSNYVGADFGVGVANGLDAIVLGLRALNIGTGDLVGVPSNTFLATWLAVNAVGATPVGIDCDETGLMNLELLESSKLKLKAVIPVHMHGQMVDMPRLMRWAEINDVRIIEDCAQAHGARIDGISAGNWGDIGAFSFYPSKNLGALGDAGFVTTNSKENALAVKSLGNYGSKPTNKYSYERLGSNSRLDSMQAAVLKVNLQYLEDWNLNRQKIAEIYNNELISQGIQPFISNPTKSVWHHYIVTSENRTELQNMFTEMDIGTEIHYPQCAEDSFSEISIHRTGNPTQARKLANSTLSLPISPWMTSKQIELVAQALRTSKILDNLRLGM